MTILDIWEECAYGATGSKTAKSPYIKSQYIFKSEKNQEIIILVADITLFKR